MDTWRLDWPFQWVVKAGGATTGWAVLQGPAVTAAQQEQFAALRRARCRLVGMSSYMSFPRGHDADPLDYESACEAWCHCFRHPESFLAGSAPRALISESDFTDPQRLDPAAVRRGAATGGDYFVYVCGPQDYQRMRKNWPLAARCIPRLCRELGLRAAVVGTRGDELVATDGVSLHPPLAWNDLLALLAGTRFLFVPNQLDASPRILAEALCLDVPILVNRAILGGWKYVNAYTGAFFDGEDDVVEAAGMCASPRRAPRTWFVANHGPHHAGERLRTLLRRVDPGLSPAAELRLSTVAAPPVVR
jgi:glycosyltransferase involved in cell wall biosynthesis